MATRSSLELMLEKIWKMEEDDDHHLPKDLPPGLPARPVTRARLPRSRRQLTLINFHKATDCEENGFMDMTTSFDGTNGKNEEYNCRNSIIDMIEKTSFLDARNETAPQEGIFRIQKNCRGHQTCCNCQELKRGVIALQSFIRGENARKHYVKNMTAIEVIQKHVKEHLRSRILGEEDQALICLPTRNAGWLAWRHFASVNGKEKQLKENTRNVRNLEKKDLDAKDRIQVPYSVLADLRMRALKTEALLDKKKEETDSLQLQIKQLERKRQQYEANMKLKEKTWQDQLTSMQISLAAAKRSSASRNAKGKLGRLFALPETNDQDENDAFPGPKTQENGRLDSTGHFTNQQNEVWDSNDGVFIQVEPGQSVSPELELQKLKLKFKAWKKNFKTRLMEAKTATKKIGNSETVKCQKRWWGR